MKTLALMLIALPLTAQAGEGAVSVVNGIRMIDASQLSVEELMAMADAERQAATRLHCCDWGGGGCDPAVARRMMSQRPTQDKTQNSDSLPQDLVAITLSHR